MRKPTAHSITTGRTPTLSAKTALNRRDVIYLAAVLCFGAILRLYHVNQPPLDYHSFRQAQTLMMARNFFADGIDLLHPRVDWLPTDSPPRTKAPVGGTEFPIVPALTALLYHLVGIQHWAGRVVSMAFALIGLTYFHLFAARLLRAQEALLAALFLTVAPLYLVTSRVQMPESFAFAMAFAGLFHFDRWIERGCPRDAVLAATGAALMLLGKPQLAVYGGAWLALALLRRGPSVLRDWRLYAIGAAAVAPVALYIPYSASLTRESGVAFTINVLFEYRYLIHWPYWTTMAAWTAKWGVGYGTLALALLGALWPAAAGRVGPFLLVWALCGIAMLVLIPGGSNSNPHYLIVFAPPCALAAARAVIALREKLAWKPATPLLAAAVVMVSLVGAREIATPVALADYRCGTWLRDNTPPETLVLYRTESPLAMYLSERRGWICWYEGEGTPIEFGPDLINRVARLGARIVAVTAPQIRTEVQPDDPFSGMRPSLRDVLYKTYANYEGEGFTLFFLNQRATMQAPLDAALPFSSVAYRKHLRGDWQFAVADLGTTMSVALPPQASGGIHVEVTGPPRRAARAKLTLAARNGDVQFEAAVNDRPCGTYPLKSAAGPTEVEMDLPAGTGPTILLTITNTAPRGSNAYLELIEAAFHP